MRDEDEREPVRDFVSAGVDSPVDPDRDTYDAAAAGGFSSLVFAVDDGFGDRDESRDLSRRSIMLRALPVSSIAFLICGATIFAAVLPALEMLPLLIFSATGSFSTIVGIVDTAGFGY